MSTNQTNQIAALENQWRSNPRWQGITRPYKAEDVVRLRGTVQVDQRTNTLIITDLRDNIGRARDLIVTLDRAQPQVEIEARIVQTNKNYARTLGVQWGFGGNV